MALAFATPQLREKRLVRHSPQGDGGSNPEYRRGNSLDCFVAIAPRNDEKCGETAFRAHSDDPE
jgi:hypothetical protein